MVLRYTYRHNGCSEYVNDDSNEQDENIPLTQHVTENNNTNDKNDSSNDETSTNKNDETQLTFMD